MRRVGARCVPEISHASPSCVLQLLKSERWNFAVFEVALCVAVGELHAELMVDSHSWVSGQRIEPPISTPGPTDVEGTGETGGFNLIGKIQPDQKGLNPPDRV